MTPRIMYDESPNRGWNVVYELGDFWNKNDELRSQCTDYLNESWWMGLSDNSASSADAFVAEHAVSFGASQSVEATLAVAVFMVIAVAMIVVLRHFALSLRAKNTEQIVSAGDGKEYGAV